MALINRITASSASSRNANTFNNTLQLLTAATGLPNNCVLLRIINDSDTLIGVSYDGANVQDIVRAHSELQLNFQANSQPNNYSAGLARGTVVYVIGAAAGNGFVYLTSYYQKDA